MVDEAAGVHNAGAGKMGRRHVDGAPRSHHSWTFTLFEREERRLSLLARRTVRHLMREFWSRTLRGTPGHLHCR